jgi:cytochrome c oxidase subunit 2
VIDTRREFEGLFVDLYLPLMIVVSVIVWGVVAFALVRYRAGRRRPPSTKSEAKVVESLYALGLAAIVAVLVWQTFTTERRVDRVSSSPGARVDIVAFKWQWRITYPGEAVPAVVGTRDHTPELVVPTDTTVRFSLTSRDVIHALWFPDFRFKRDAFPHRTTRFDLVFDKAGSFTGRCAEFCGLDHAEMTMRVRAVAPAEFESWLEDRRG